MIPAPTKRRAPLALLGVLAVLASAVPAAHAGGYVVDHCKNFDTDAGGVAFGDFGGATTNSCGTGGGLHHQIGAGGMAANTSAIMALSIPADRPNITIQRVITTYSAPAPSALPPAAGTPFLALFNHLGQEMRNNIPPATPTVDSALPPGARSLTWSLYCASDAGGANCQLSSDFVLSVHKTRLFLVEYVAPKLTVNGGTLTAAGAKAGPQSLAYDVSDTDSGVASVTVSLGSNVIGSVAYPCPSTDWSACPRKLDDQLLQVDTAKAPDGVHELLVTVRDKADNVLTRSLGRIQTINGRPGAPNGANPSRQAKISARFVTTKARTRRLRFGARPTVRGRLVNEQNQPITGASIAVLQRRRQAGADDVQVATVTTGTDGRFAYKLSGGPSRTLRFAYSAFTGDAKPTTTSTLRTTVRAIVSARISPRSVRAGRRITLSGRLRLLPREGVEVKIQARDGREWRTISDVRTRRGGRFTWSYRFKSSGAGSTFAFRARVASPIYPFAASSSKAMRVSVR